MKLEKELREAMNTAGNPGKDFVNFMMSSDINFRSILIIGSC